MHGCVAPYTVIRGQRLATYLFYRTQGLNSIGKKIGLRLHPKDEFVITSDTVTKTAFPASTFGKGCSGAGFTKQGLYGKLLQLHQTTA